MISVIDVTELERVCGGQTRTTETEGGVQTPYGSGTVRHSSSSSEPNGYLRCGNDVRRDAGWIQRTFNPSGVQDRVNQSCSGMYGSPQNPERPPS